MSLDRIHSLIGWARYHGAHFHERAEAYEDPQYGISLRVRFSEHSTDIGAGSNQLLSERYGLAPNSCIVSCPFSLSLSYLNALNKSPELQSHSTRFPARFCETLEPHIIGHFFLIQQYLNAGTSFWGPYVRSLPQPNDSEILGTPLYFAEADIAWIRGTDLEIARNRRETTWKSDWERGRLIMDTSSGWEEWQGRWTWDLYKWAATIFSSRSFVSTLIPREILRTPVTHGTRSFNGIFPVLFPLLDLANHSSDAKVTWFTNVQNKPNDLSIINESEIPYGRQIFNNYAPKSNTELMLGYGFSTPGNDEVSIAFKPLGVDLTVIRERQLVYRGSQSADAKKHIFHVRAMSYNGSSSSQKLPELRLFEDGCVDTISLLVANQRERDYMTQNPQNNLEKVDEKYAGPLSRNLFRVMSTLLEKLENMLDVIEIKSENLGIPANSCQRAAKTYREGQISVLQVATDIIRQPLETALSQHSICNHSSGFRVGKEIIFGKRLGMELVRLPCAFSWLQKTNRTLYDHCIEIAAKELETTTVAGLDWLELIASGWDFTMWCFWIYMVVLLYLSHREGSDQSFVTCWIENVFNTYDHDKTFSGHSYQCFRGDKDEAETLKLMVDQIGFMQIPNTTLINSAGNRGELNRRLLNFASLVAMEETFTVGVNKKDDEAKEIVHQRVLFIGKDPHMYGLQ